MKDFDLQAAQAGGLLCLEDGTPARFLADDLRIKSGDLGVVVAIDGGHGPEVLGVFDYDGYPVSSNDTQKLCMQSDTKHGYINLFRAYDSGSNKYLTQPLGPVYESITEAKNSVRGACLRDDQYVDTVEISFEETKY